MARIKGSSGAKTSLAIRQAGLQLIHRHGFEATSLRQIAALVGIREGSLYNHISSKQDLLFRLVEDHMNDLLAALADSLAGIEAPLPRLDRFIEFHLTYHMQRPAEVFVINSELRSLDPEARAAIVAKRDHYEGILRRILEDGQQEGSLATVDSPVLTKAILAMLTGVCTWFKPDGRLDIASIIALHRTLIFQGIRRFSP